MRADGFTVDMEALRSLAEQMLETLEAFEHDASELNESMMALSAQWEGPANESFRLAFGRDYEQTCEDIRVTRGAIELILKNETQYRETETAVQSLVESIQI